MLLELVNVMLLGYADTTHGIRLIEDFLGDATRNKQSFNE
jgi:hypothetical protein